MNMNHTAVSMSDNGLAKFRIGCGYANDLGRESLLTYPVVYHPCKPFLAGIATDSELGLHLTWYIPGLPSWDQMTTCTARQLD
jgi:hypothetical protein